MVTKFSVLRTSAPTKTYSWPLAFGNIVVPDRTTASFKGEAPLNILNYTTEEKKTYRSMGAEVASLKKRKCIYMMYKQNTRDKSSDFVCDNTTYITSNPL